MKFSEVENKVFFSQKVDRNMIFTDYWKVLVLNSSEIRNTVFFWAKELMERWYSLSTEKFMFWTFPRWEIWSFFEPKSWWKMMFTNKWKVRVLNFSVIGNTVFFQLKSLWKDNIYLVFLSFHDNPGLGKYGFLCSETLQQYKIK